MRFSKLIINYSNTNSIVSRLRAKRLKPLLSMIDKIHDKNGCVNILDVGGTEQYWNIVPGDLLENKNVSITLLNLPGENKKASNRAYKYLEGDACELSHISDYSFDIVHSNSVIEHVGDWGRMLQFSNEIKRLAKNYYLQTPYYWFPVEPHCMTLFFHWLPKPIRVALVMKFSLGNWSRQRSVSDAVRVVESARLLDIKMFRALFEEADILVEKFFFLPKSLMAIRKE